MGCGTRLWGSLSARRLVTGATGELPTRRRFPTCPTEPDHAAFPQDCYAPHGRFRNIAPPARCAPIGVMCEMRAFGDGALLLRGGIRTAAWGFTQVDRKSTRLNSSHAN